MKIIKGGKLITELPDEPKDFDCMSKRGTISIAVLGVGDVKLGSYTQERASEVMDALHDAYFANQAEFILPEE